MSEIEAAYRRYQPLLRAKCARMLGPAEADDIVQDTFLRFVRSRAMGRAPEVAIAWLYRVATRLAIDRLRSRSRQQRAHDAMPGAPTIDRRGANEARSVLRRVAARAPRRCLEVAVLHRIDGLTHAEVAEVCRCSTRTVRRLLRRFDEAAARVMAS